MILLSVLGTSALLYFSAKKALEGEVSIAQATIAQSTAKYVEAVINKYFSELQTITNYDRFRNVNNIADTQAQVSAEQENRSRILTILNKMLDKNPEILSLSVARGDGQSYDTKGNAYNAKDNEYFKLALQGQQNITSPALNKEFNQFTTVVSVPIEDDAGKKIGVLSAHVDSRVFSKVMSDIKIGKSGHPFMIDKDAYTIAHSNFALVEQRDNDLENVKSDPLLAPLAEIEKKMITGETGVGEYDYGGIRKFVGYAPVGNTGWSIAATAPDSEIFEGLYRMSRVAFYAGIAMILSTSVIGWYSMRGIGRSIKAMAGHLDVISKGNLAVNVPDEFLNYRDEIGIAANSAQRMLLSLRESMEQINSAISELSLTSEMFKENVLRADGAVSKTGISVTQVNSSMEELTKTAGSINLSIDEVASGAHSLAERGTEIAMEVKNANESGVNGVNAVQKVVQSIEGVARDTIQASKDAKLLVERARQIQGFVTQIGGIADQTNLLALNAAIEAARAGEAGRGFAVVADEVRKLAEESNEAAKKIADLAALITRDLDGVVKASEKNAKDSNYSNELASKTEQAINSMISALDSISSGTEDSAAVSEQQAAASKEISHAIHEMTERIKEATSASELIKQQMDEISSGSEVIGTGAEKISGLASTLGEAVSIFKLT